ncbi:hypothetical protein V1264_013191 [Littorina saxatilis]|uniref:Uncharacterized protein n=1 Tax=Littorina saxatilis TaxID=31220 RepID=A0AAN9GHW4_9CAEN
MSDSLLVSTSCCTWPRDDHPHNLECSRQCHHCIYGLYTTCYRVSRCCCCALRTRPYTLCIEKYDPGCREACRLCIDRCADDMSDSLLVSTSCCTWPRDDHPHSLCRNHWTDRTENPHTDYCKGSSCHLTCSTQLYTLNTLIH